MIRKKGMVFRALLGAVVVLLLGGCSIGPTLLKTDYIQYNISVQEGFRKEMLLNLVRVRHLETPFFLQVGAISSTHQFSNSIGGTANTPDKRYPLLGIVPTFGLTLNNTVGETPTVTYMPLSGEKYVQRILGDFKMDDFFSLYDSGWNSVMRILLFVLMEQIGDLKYQLDTDEVEPVSLSKLVTLVDLLSQIYMRGDLKISVVEGESILLSNQISGKEVNSSAIIAADRGGYYYRSTGNGNYELRKKSGLRYVMLMQYRNAQEADKVDSLLGIKSKMKGTGMKGLKRAVELSTVEIPEEENRKRDIPAVFIDFRSFQQVLTDLSAGIDLPDSSEQSWDGSEAPVTNPAPNPFRDAIRPIFHVKCSSVAPSAFLSVFYRGNWFYIDNADISSKITFDLVEILFSLKSAASQIQTPTLTIPVR
ncbi:MAG: hypothetical protein ABII06_18480 [Pseudomonadota bacterium]